MLRRVERGAALLTLLLALGALALLLLAPVVPYCAVAISGARGCPARSVRYESLPRAGLAADAWAFLLALFVVVVAGGALALRDARLAGGARPALWATLALAVAGCALAARGPVGAVFLPAVVALALAAYLSLLRQRAGG